MLAPAAEIPRFTQSCVEIQDILSVAARFYALVLGGTEPAFTDDLYVTGAGFAYDGFHDQGFCFAIF